MNTLRNEMKYFVWPRASAQIPVLMKSVPSRLLILYLVIIQRHTVTRLAAILFESPRS